VSANSTEPLHLFCVALIIQEIMFNEIKNWIISVDIISCVPVYVTLELIMVSVTFQLRIFLNDCAYNLCTESLTVSFCLFRNVRPIRSFGSIVGMRLETVGSYDVGLFEQTMILS
jgi:hypothetical protein